MKRSAKGPMPHPIHRSPDRPRSGRGLALSASVSLLALIAACGSTRPEIVEPIEPPALAPDASVAAPERQPPPPSGPRRDVSFPAITRAELGSGLELNTVSWRQLPIVYLRLVVRSGSEADPSETPGMANLVADMLKEGTRNRSSATIAEQIEFLGADLSVGADEENTYITMRALAEHMDAAMELLADVAMNPSFRADELEKLTVRELDRLTVSQQRPEWLARRAFYQELYGDHPYGHVDTTPEVLRRIRRADLARWHRAHFVPSNAFLVITGDVSPEQAQARAEAHFGRWRDRPSSTPAAAPPPEPEGRRVIVIDRPGSIQSLIFIGNRAIERGHEDWVRLAVANQVLGGSAASRLFMDLRERRSLTYGAYSQVGERVQVAPFISYASVETPNTGPALDAFFEHLDRIVAEEPSEEEIANARRFLSDSFPLQIDTPGKINSMIADLRIFGMADDYWDRFRTRILEVDGQAA
ncbi:MAG: insulinase family protein, partial [Myxococcales bacterium]|nr:insulinase family protein [Myxococcales bacterium]